MSAAPLTLLRASPPAPSPVRAQPLQLGTDAKGALLAYPVGNYVVVRNLLDLKADTIVCAKHSAPVTCARISPKGDLVASGDRDGNLLIWLNKQDTRVTLQQKALGGAVRDIAWNEEGDRLIVVGEGKTTFGVAISADGGNTIGQINGHDKGIVSADFRKQRPYRAVTGGADSAVGFFEGLPFKFKHTVAGQHTSNVTCVRFSPSGDTIASVSGKNTIVLLDGNSGELLRAIPTTHSGTILGLSWASNGDAIATCSADKTVKIHTLAGSEALSLSFGSTIPFMQQGIAHFANGIVSCGFNGDLNIIDVAAGAPVAVLRGHNRPLAFVNYSDTGALFSISVDGTALAWEEGRAAAVTGAQLELAQCAVIAPDGSVLAAGGTEVMSYNPGKATASSLVKSTSAVLGLAAFGAHLTLLHKNSIDILDRQGRAVGNHKLVDQDGAKLDGTSLAAHVESGLLAVGCEKGCVVVLQLSGTTLSFVSRFAGHKTDVSSVAISRDGGWIASGDTSRVIFVWNARTGELVYDDLVFHNSKITALAFGASSGLLLSASVDASIILWDLPNKKRSVQNNAHLGGVTAVALHPTLPRAVTGGVDCFIREWGFEI